MKVVSVRLREVVRRFGAHLAVRHVSLTLSAGELVLLLGPNGAGKTTLLSMLAGLLRPTRGVIEADLQVEGVEAPVTVAWEALMAEAPHAVGLVSHASLLYEDLSGVENLELFAGLYGLPDVSARCDALLKRVDLEAAAHRRVVTYSRGMRQRLSIARALLQDPSVLLLDEPYTGLDSAGMRLLNALLDEQRRAGRLVVLITHQLDLPPDLIDRAVVIQSGRVVADGRVEGRVAAWYERQLSAEASPS